MRLKYQLFVILLVASATLIASLFAFNSWSFNRGFVDYLNRAQTESLRSLADTLADGYAEQNSWNWLTKDSAQWRRLSSDAWTNTLRQAGSPSPPPRANREQSSPSAPRLSRPPERTSPRRAPPLILVDAQQNTLFGRFKEDDAVAWIPIGPETEPHGFLGYRLKDRLPRQLDNVFANQQRKSFAMASLLMVGLSALLAGLLASRIVKPVVDVSEAVAVIRGGDYTQRVVTQRRDELGDLSRDVNQLASTLEYSRTARRKWIAEISHELRTPLAILQGEVEAIADGIRPFDTNSLSSLHAETQRLSRLVNDLHDLSLSDLGALNYQMAPMSLIQVLRQRLVAAEPQRLEKSLTIDVKALDGEYPMLGDQQRIGQLLDNLLQNSIRYTHEGGTVNIELSQSQGGVNVRWMDSSPGVSDADLPLLFDPLFRAEQSRNRSSGGAGLGLAIAEKIVKAHQGSISATHSATGGLQIEMRLPSGEHYS